MDDTPVDGTSCDAGFGLPIRSRMSAMSTLPGLEFTSPIVHTPGINLLAARIGISAPWRRRYQCPTASACHYKRFREREFIFQDLFATPGRIHRVFCKAAIMLALLAFVAVTRCRIS
jgi:hypothetical protein